ASIEAEVAHLAESAAGAGGGFRQGDGRAGNGDRRLADDAEEGGRHLACDRDLHALCGGATTDAAGVWRCHRDGGVVDAAGKATRWRVVGGGDGPGVGAERAGQVAGDVIRARDGGGVGRRLRLPQLDVGHTHVDRQPYEREQAN